MSTPELMDRVSQAMNVGNPTPAQRNKIVDAMQDAETFNQLPGEVQALIERLESKNR